MTGRSGPLLQERSIKAKPANQPPTAQQASALQHIPSDRNSPPRDNTWMSVPEIPKNYRREGQGLAPRRGSVDGYEHVRDDRHANRIAGLPPCIGLWFESFVSPTASVKYLHRANMKDSKVLWV